MRLRKIDLERHVIVLHSKRNGDSLLKSLQRVAHHENRQRFKRGNPLCEFAAIRWMQEQNMAAFGLFG